METGTFELGFAKFIEKFDEQIKESYLKDAFETRGLFTNYSGGREMLVDLAQGICSEFTNNIDRRTSVDLISERYVELGKKCAKMNVSFSEMVRAIILLKRHIWLFFQDSNFAGQPFDVRSIVALNNRTALFFDRAIYFFLAGYEQSSREDCSEAQQLYEILLNMIRRDLGLAGTRDEQ